MNTKECSRVVYGHPQCGIHSKHCGLNTSEVSACSHKNVMYYQVLTRKITFRQEQEGKLKNIRVSIKTCSCI